MKYINISKSITINSINFPCVFSLNDTIRKSEMPFPLQLNCPVWLKVFVYIYIYIYGCILITSDHNHGLAHYAPAHCCSCHTRAYFFFSLFGCLCEKNGATKNPPRIPVTFCDFPFSSETPYALTVTGSTSRYGPFFLNSVPQKKCKKSEPVTCA